MVHIKDMIPSPACSALACLVAGLAVFTSGCGEEATAPPTPDPALQASLAAPALTFRMVGIGGWHTCGVASDSRAYCWGLNDRGQLGIGNKVNRSRPTPVDRPVLFQHVDGGYEHTCGLTTDNLAYCWGSSDYGQLGFGGITGRVRPVPVTGGLRFRQINVGPYYSCGLTTDNRAYCWGRNSGGALGDGTTTDRHAPVPVAGGLRFRRIDASGYTCGVTTADKVYCWGGEHHVPTAIPGGLSFLQVTAGCGFTADRKGYCWESYGQPQPLAGGRTWNQLAVGLTHSCGVTTANRAFCWEDNFTGALGDGTETDRAVPTAVVGGLLFSGASPGVGSHTCAVATNGRAYCWGHNAYGQLGLGSNIGPETCNFSLPCSRRPRPVIGPV